MNSTSSGPPIIGTPTLDPSNPRSWNDVVVSVTILDDQNVKNATLHYRIDEGQWQSVSMTKAGNTYFGTIPSAPDGSNVTYYITAYDSTDLLSRKPSDATEFFSYTVIDDQESPVISEVLELDVRPMSSESILINATITDDVAIENATLYYQVDDGSWTAVTMTKEGDIFEATIPPQPFHPPLQFSPQQILKTLKPEQSVSW